MALEPATQHQIIIAAAILAGPNGSDQDVAGHTSRIAGLLSEGSLPMNAFGQLEKRDAAVIKTQGFPATVIGIDRETTSTRGVVLLYTGPSDQHANGQEFIRTQRTDTPEGLAQARALQALIGHKVFITKEISTGNGSTNKAVRSFEDKGVDPDYMATVVAQDGRNVQTNPAYVYDYDVPQRQGGMGGDMLARLASRQQALQPA